MRGRERERERNIVLIYMCYLGWGDVGAIGGGGLGASLANKLKSKKASEWSEELVIEEDEQPGNYQIRSFFHFAFVSLL